MATKAQLKEPLIDDASKKAAPAKVQGASIAAFWGHVALATRTSGAMTLCSLVIFIPALYNTINSSPLWSPYLGYIGGGVNLMILFTVYANYGSTVQLFWQGGIGTFWACFWAYFMNGLMPYGAAGDQYYAPLAHAAHITFILMFMWLNVTKNVRVFVISYQVYFAMDFMNPATVKGAYNSSWAFDFDSAATTTLLTAVAGLCGALCVMLLPKPIMAKRNAEDAAKSTTVRVCDLMDELVEYFQRSSPSVIITQKEVEAASLKTAVSGMMDAIDASWWENFDLSSAASKSRQFLAGHVDMLKIMCDNVSAMQICLAKEDFGKTHVQCMKQIEAPIAELMAATRELLIRATDAASDGDISASETETLDGCIARTRMAIASLGQAFNKARKTMFPIKVDDNTKKQKEKQIINLDLQSESFFVWCLSAYARHAVEYSYLMLKKPPTAKSFAQALKTAVVGIVDRDVLVHRLKVTAFTFRGTLSILVCYYIGMYWVGFNAVAAGNVALLISDFAGSALQKNLGRIQAVVIGAVVPHILYMVMGTECETHLIIVRICVFFLFELIMCYIYYSSATYGFIGILSGAFALSSLIYSCGPTPTAADEQTFGVLAFQKMTQTIMGVLIMTGIDMVLSSDRASDIARKELIQGMLAVDTHFQCAFEERDEDGGLSEDAKAQLKCRADIVDYHEYSRKVLKMFHGKSQSQTAFASLSGASTFGKEADLEPRYHRSAWPTTFFDYQVAKTSSLRVNLVVAEQVLKGTRRQGVQQYTPLSSASGTDAWVAVKQDVQDSMGVCIEIVQAILHNETGKPMPRIKEKLKSLEGIEKLESMPSLFSAINKSALAYPADASIKTMEDDEICRLNVLLMLFESNIEILADMMKSCLKML